MDKNVVKRGRCFRLAHGALAISLCWTLIAASSIFWNLRQHNRETRAIVLNVAKTHLEKDTIFRRWGVGHGGVYVPATPQTQPNPYLDPRFVPERDLITPSGRHLTLINPAYMIRQLYDALPGQEHPQARVVSLKPIRPQNLADSWEALAISAFAKGDEEVSELVPARGGQGEMRLMRPFFAESACLAQCHAHQGYREGDIMGGISIKVAMAPFDRETRHHTYTIWFGHLFLWLLGLVGIGVSYATLQRRNEARLQSEEALRRSEERFRSLIENALDIITVLDSDGGIVFKSPSLERVLGYQPARLLGRPLDEFLHPEDQAKVAGVLGRLAAQPGETETFEARWRHSDGSWRILEAVGKRLGSDLPPAAYVINSRDITPRKEAEEKLFSYQAQLRSLASRLSLAEEQARRQLATDLHEQIGQNLSVIKLKLGGLTRSAESPAALAQLNEVGDLLDMTLDDTRDLTFELSPPILYDIGLEASIKWAAEKFRQRHNIVCLAEDDGQAKPLGEDLRGVLYRSVLEALNNIMKHANARTVRISMRREEHTIRITVADDGVGFDYEGLAAQPGQPAGFGLFSIRERLELFGGYLSVISAPGQGTRLELMAPLKVAAEGGTGGEEQL